MDTQEANLQKVLNDCEEEMKDRVEKLRGEFGAIRTGRASPQLVEGVKVEYYGQPVPMKQVASLSVAEGRTLEIRPWDPTALEAIEKALHKADLGATPQNDGKMIRLSFPSMTAERRQELVKVVRKMAEEAKVSIRNSRRDFLEKVKKSEKAKEISEDERLRQEGLVQKLTDSYVAKVDEVVASKEKDITTI